MKQSEQEPASMEATAGDISSDDGSNAKLKRKKIKRTKSSDKSSIRKSSSSSSISKKKKTVLAQAGEKVVSDDDDDVNNNVNDTATKKKKRSSSSTRSLTEEKKKTASETKKKTKKKKPKGGAGQPKATNHNVTDGIAPTHLRLHQSKGAYLGQGVPQTTLSASNDLPSITQPGAVRVASGMQRSSDSSSSEEEQYTDEEDDPEQPPNPQDKEPIVHAQLVDEAAIEQEALKKLVVDAEAELVDEEAIQEKEERRKKRRRNERIGCLAMLAACFCCGKLAPNSIPLVACGCAAAVSFTTVAVVVPVVVVTTLNNKEEEDDSENSTIPIATTAPVSLDIFEETAAPVTSAPTLAPTTRAPTTASPTINTTTTAPTSQPTDPVPICTIRGELPQSQTSSWTALEFVDTFGEAQASYDESEFHCTRPYCGLGENEYLRTEDCKGVRCSWPNSCTGFTMQASAQVSCDAQEACRGARIEDLGGAGPLVNCLGSSACFEATIDAVPVANNSEEPILNCTGTLACQAASIDLGGPNQGVVFCLGGTSSPACIQGTNIISRCLVCVGSRPQGVEGCAQGITFNDQDLQGSVGFCGECDGVEEANDLDNICAGL